MNQPVCPHSHARSICLAVAGTRRLGARRLRPTPRTPHSPFVHRRRTTRPGPGGAARCRCAALVTRAPYGRRGHFAQGGPCGSWVRRCVPDEGGLRRRWMPSLDATTRPPDRRPSLPSPGELVLDSHVANTGVVVDGCRVLQSCATSRSSVGSIRSIATGWAGSVVKSVASPRHLRRQPSDLVLSTAWDSRSPWLPLTPRSMEAVGLVRWSGGSVVPRVGSLPAQRTAEMQ